MEKKKQNKDDCCFCPKIMRLSELRDMKLQMISFQLKEIIKIINIDNIEDEYPDIKF